MNDLDPERAATHVLGHSRDDEAIEVYGLDRAVLTIEAGTGGQLLGVGRAETRGIGIRVVRSQRTGYASTSDLSGTALGECLRLARGAARVARSDAAARLPAPLPAAKVSGLVHPGLAALPVAAKAALVRDLATAATALDPRVRSIHAATYREERARVHIASTTGVHAGYARSWAALSVGVLGEDRGILAAESAHQTVRDPADLNPEAVAAAAVARATRLLGPRRPLPHDVPLLLDPEVTAAVLSAVGGALIGGAQRGGPLTGDVGASFAAACVSISDDGLDPRFPNSAPWDDEGIPHSRTRLIADGMVVGALHSTQTAATLGDGARSTGNARRGSHKAPPGAAPTTLVLSPTCGDPWRFAPDMAYVQQLASGHAPVDPVTGHIGVGVVGFRVRDGQPAGPAENWSLETSLRELLVGVLAVGDDATLIPGFPAVASSIVCDATVHRSGRSAMPDK